MGKKDRVKKSDYYLLENKEIVIETISGKINTANDSLRTPINNDEDLKKIKKSHTAWKDYIKEYLNRVFSNGTISEAFATSSLSMAISINPSLGRTTSDFKESFEKEIAYLESLIERIDLIPVRNDSSNNGTNHPLNNNIFIVHGQRHEIKSEVARFIERIKLQAIILDEQANEGKTIIEKFEHYSSTCRTAIVILTADDLVVNDGALEPSYRARQNVILELGYFLSSLKREGVIALYEEKVEIPSDFYGVLYIPLKDDWKFKVARELKKRGLDIDLNALAD